MPTEIDGYMASYEGLMDTPDDATVLLTFNVHKTPAQPLGKYGEEPDPRAVKYILGRHPDWNVHIGTIIKQGVSAAVPKELWDTYHEWANTPEINFNEYLEDIAREKYGQCLKERELGSVTDEVVLENDRWHEVSGSNESCGLTGAEVSLSGAELKELARLAWERAQMSESEEAEPCG
jgi:hypothetical protein